MRDGPSHDAQGLEDILDALSDAAEGDSVTLGDLMDAFGRRSFGPLLLVPAVIALAPTGAIPGMSIATGSVIILIAGQMLLPIDHPWLPRRLEDIAIGRKTFDKSMRLARPVARAVDTVTERRLETVVEPPILHIVALVCIVMAATMYPLALVPFGVAIPAAAISIMALGLTARDGLVAGLGLLGSLAGAALIWHLLS